MGRFQCGADLGRTDLLGATTAEVGFQSWWFSGWEQENGLGLPGYSILSVATEVRHWTALSGTALFWHHEGSGAGGSEYNIRSTRMEAIYRAQATGGKNPTKLPPSRWKQSLAQRRTEGQRRWHSVQAEYGRPRLCWCSKVSRNSLAGGNPLLRVADLDWKSVTGRPMGGTSSTAVFRISTNGTDHIVLKHFTGSDGRYQTQGWCGPVTCCTGQPSGAAQMTTALFFTMSITGNNF